MKLLFIALSCGFLISHAQSQIYVDIELSPPSGSMEYLSFSIDSVVDQRAMQDHIGVVYKGRYKKRNNARLKGGMEQAIHAFMHKLAPARENALPLTLIIEKFEIKERNFRSLEVAYLEIRASFYDSGKKITTLTVMEHQKDDDATHLHSSNIAQALRSLIIRMESGEDDTESTSVAKGKKQEVQQEESEIINQLKDQDTKSRTAVIVGYQIGGWTLIGMDIELRVADYVGIHFGGGLAGYTAGMKFHFTPSKNSGFVNISYKDGGFGLVQSLNAEVGGKILFSKPSDFGLFGQVGLGYIFAIDPQFERDLFDSDDGSAAILSIGVGFGF